MSGFTPDQRRHGRPKLSISAWLRFKDELAQWGTVTVDIGKEGARFSTLKHVSMGEHVLLTVQLEPTTQSIECKGQVCWSRCSQDGRCEFGVRFIDLNEEERESLERFLSSGGAVVSLVFQ